MANKKISTPLKAFPGIAFYPQVFSLASLYRSKATRCAVRGLLGDLFENNFNTLIISATKKRSNFITEALEHKSLIRKIFIEYGLPIETVDDIKTMLQLLPQYENLPDPEQCENLMEKWQKLVESEVECLLKNGPVNSDYDSSNEDSDSEVPKTVNTTRCTIEVVKN